MRLKELRLDIEETQHYGLKEFYSSKFSSVIALVGKNGSGKSRYLRVIEDHIRSLKIDTDFEKKFSSITNEFVEGYKYYLDNQDLYNSYYGFIDAQNAHTRENTIETQNNLTLASSKFNRVSTKSNARPHDFDKFNQNITLEIEKRIKIIKPDDLRKLKASFENNKNKATFQSTIDSTLENIDINEFEMISESALTYLQRLPHKLAFDKLDCMGDDKKFKNRVAYKRFELLSNLIRDFLGKELEWHSRKSNMDEFDDHVAIKAMGYWTIKGREFLYDDLSDGEKVLFTYAILLFLLSTNAKIKFKESIIIIDEPELNLHPKAQVKLIETLAGIIKEKGQLIIATHSLSIIANLDYGSIFLVREGELLTPSSAIPYSAIDELMGFEEHFNKIVQFLVSTPSWAMTNFMAQCFLDAEVFDSATKNDPQLDLFRKLIMNENDLVILDFGSGKGRLLDRIKESDETWERIKKYDCFDIQEEYNEIVYEKGASEVFNDIKQIPDNKYDLIIMVNVLHEIHIKHWEESLLKIKKSLKPQGFLALIEDVELPIGELPNELGFLLLEKEEMKILLGDGINFLNSPIERYKNRILCGLISKEMMNIVNKNKVISTLKKLKENSLKSIINYRKENSNETGIGRLYALKSNSYVNSELAINYLNDVIENESIINKQQQKLKGMKDIKNPAK